MSSHQLLPEQDLRADHERYPLTIFKHPDNKQPKFVILVETFHECYNSIVDFIVSIAEPISRPQYVHEYWMTDNSLKAAVSLGITSEIVKETLLKYSKYRQLPIELNKILRSGTDQIISLQIISNSQYIVRLPLDFMRNISRPEPDFQLIRSFLKTVPNDDEDKIFDAFHMDTSTNKLLIETNTYRPVKKLIDIKRITEFRCLINQHFLHDYTVIEEAYVPCDFPKNTYEDFQKQMHEFECKKARKFDIMDDYLEFMEAKQHSDLVEEGVRNAFDAAKNLKEKRFPAAIQASIKPTTVLRPYQMLSMQKVVYYREIDGKKFQKLQSGLIVLPCGSGKSLQGIATACYIGASCIIVTNGNLSSNQWKSQFLQFTTIDEKRIYMFSTDQEDNFWQAAQNQRDVFTPGYHTVLIATYNMLTNEKPSKYASCTRQLIHCNLWGIVLFDEAHGLFAKSFKTMFLTDETSKNFLKSYSKILLTATPLREDKQLDDKLVLIGSKLFESNWSDLSKMGYIAVLNCSEVSCGISRDFYIRYKNVLTTQSTSTLQNDVYNYISRMTQRAKEALGTYTHYRIKNEQTTKSDIRPNFLSILPVMNPQKLRICSLLKNYHASLQDQILIFCDSIICAQTYARLLNIPYITGACPQSEREAIVRAFMDRYINCFMLSRVGDTSLDLPDANVLIEIDWQQGSRRQETQRIGRISRPKSNGQSGYFYILVSEETREMQSASDRRSYLSVNQGYSFSALKDMEIERQCQRAGITVDPQVAQIIQGNHDEFLLEMLVLSVQRSEGQRRVD